MNHKPAKLMKNCLKPELVEPFAPGRRVGDGDPPSIYVCFIEEYAGVCNKTKIHRQYMQRSLL
jgi:hypothetical protein